MNTIDEVITALEQGTRSSIIDDAIFYLNELRRRMNEETSVGCHDGVCKIDFDEIKKQSREA